MHLSTCFLDSLPPGLQGIGAHPSCHEAVGVMSEKQKESLVYHKEKMFKSWVTASMFGPHPGEG